MPVNVLMEKLLDTVVNLKASDLHIAVGQPPVLRHHGRLRRLDTKILDNDDTTALMKSITPDRCQQELQEKGGADFAIEYAVILGAPEVAPPEVVVRIRPYR